MLSQSSTPPLPDTASTEPSPAIAAALESFGRYYDDVLLPMWLGPGWNAQAGLCYEALIVDNGALVPASTAR
ncbi:N-acylglucosamine 2-epimerase, partial [Corallococcus sp. CA041A]